MKKAFFESFGLSKNESMIYEVLLKGKSMTIADIASKTGLHRPSVYQTVPALLSKGLIARVPKGKRTFYMAQSPDSFERYLSGLTERYREVLPSLQETFENATGVATIRSYEGIEGIQEVFMDLVRHLKPGDTYYRYSSGRDRHSNQYEKYRSAEYSEVRDKKQLERFTISTPQDAYRLKNQTLDSVVRIVPKEFSFFPHDMSHVIYDDRVSVIDYKTETAFIIENATYAAFSKNLFKLVFSLLGDLPENQKLQ